MTKLKLNFNLQGFLVSFRWALILLVVVGCAAKEQPVTVAEPSAAEDLRRFAAILDYVAADYGGAVKDGVVVDEAEYKEQHAFVKDARDLARRLPPSPIDTEAQLARIGALVDAKAPASEVAEACRTLRRRILDAHGVILAPVAAPSLARGRELYAQACVQCHGSSGGGDGPEAARLDPPPRSFRDPEVLADLSPARAFSALTDGIDGTAMASFGAFSPSDRWSLSFYIFTFRHDEADVAAGAQAWERAGRRVSATPTRLASASDGELLRELEAAGLDEAARAQALAFLRVRAPYEQTGAPLDRSRQLLFAAVAAYEKGDASGARQAASSAYLDGFEPHEGALRARDPQLVLKLEERFVAVRELLADGAPPQKVEAVALQIGALLDRAEESLGGGESPSVAFGAAFLVIVREGLEAALLIMLLLGLARRAGAGADLRAAHAGWLAAVALGVVTWFASGPILRLGGARRELVEGLVALLASAVLLGAGHYVLARLDARRRVEALRRRFENAHPTRRRAILVGLGFVAVYREAFEVVLFLRAILLGPNASVGAVAAGAGAGAAACALLVVLLGRAGRRLSPARWLTASGTLLCLLAVILAGKGVRALQEAGVLGIAPLALPRLDWIGLFPTVQGVAVQLAVLAAFVAIAVLSSVRARDGRLGSE